MTSGIPLFGSLCVALILVQGAEAADWLRFRGPNGSGVSATAEPPLTWSETENLRWKTPLPGPGSSSPIVVGQRLFVTCYTGYGVDEDEAANQSSLRRHLICVQRSDGKVLWSKSIEAVLPEDPHRGYIGEHGYASSTPVSDGERVYVFFGKSGVLAFDLDGAQLWQTSVGTESGRMGWGSAASPILYEDLVIVNAAEESQSIRALDKRTGREVWASEADGLENSWSTPVLVDGANGRQELAIAVPNEVWGINPDTGRLRWYAEVELASPVCASPVTAEGIVYAVGERRSASAAIRAGGKGNVTETHMLWSASVGSYVPSPLFHNGYLFWVNNRGIAFCIDAKTGNEIYRERLSTEQGQPEHYASVVLAGQRIYAVSRRSGVFVLAVGPDFRQLAHNRFASDSSDFNASPAISDDQLFLRSNRFLYCIQADSPD